MKSAISEELKNEISELRSRARVADYKNVMPRLPKEQITQKAFDNLMMGFNKRLQNWKNGLIQLENPGGLYNGKKRGQTDEKSDVVFRSGQFVSNSLTELANLS
jgi:hypothetical protein